MKHIKFSIAAIFCIYAITGGCDSGNNNKPATVFSSAIAKKDDTLTLNLCGVEGGAYNIPWSVDLPEAQDIPGFPDTTALINFLQNRFDELSWKTFIALNWPSLENGDPDSTTCFTKNTGIAVWESWMPSSKIFVPAGQTPAPWKTGTLKAAAYYGVSAAALAGGSQKPGNIHPANSGTFATLRIGKVDSAFTILDAEQFPVIDKNHMYTLFENFYNKEAYDYIVKSKLYSRAGQKEFTKNWPSFTKGLTMTSGNKTINIESAFKRAYFPVGNFKDSSKVIGDTTYTFSKNEGAIIIKSAWIVLTDSSEYHDYFTRTIRIKEKVGIKTRTLGLVAMHIIHKVAETTQWVWSSFEHNNNAPLLDSTGKADLKPGIDYLYFDEQNNDPSLYNTHPDSIYQPYPFSRKPSQIVELSPSLKSTDRINDQFHALIAQNDKKSVWLNYRLVGTQWPFNPNLFTSGSDYQPALLANPIMETYIQSTSSCMSCHSSARFLFNPSKDKKKFSYGYNSDFVWGLNDAK